MTKSFRSLTVLAATALVATGMSFAQAGAATYKTKCAMCHGATGTPSAGMAKSMGIKAASDPETQKLTLAEVEGVIKNGKGKMKPVAGLADDQIKDVATYFRSLK